MQDFAGLCIQDRARLPARRPPRLLLANLPRRVSP